MKTSRFTITRLVLVGLANGLILGYLTLSASNTPLLDLLAAISACAFGAASILLLELTALLYSNNAFTVGTNQLGLCGFSLITSGLWLTGYLLQLGYLHLLLAAVAIILLLGGVALWVVMLVLKSTE